MKLNKTNLGRIIKWSSSIYNPFKKDEVLNQIIEYSNDATKQDSFRISTGSFVNCRGWGWAYVITKLSNGKYISITHDVTKECWFLEK